MDTALIVLIGIFLLVVVAIILMVIAIPIHFFIRSNTGGWVGKHLPYYPRFMHWLWAYIAGYWWLPCTLCGKKRGAHEPDGTLMTDFGSGVSVCRWCASEAEKTNKERQPEFDRQASVHYSQFFTNRKINEKS